MKFRTEIDIVQHDNPIEHSEKILTIGSCFAQNIGNYFVDAKMDAMINPFGVLYNPVSILNSVKLLSGKIKFSEDELIYDQGEWHSFYHHSDFSHHDKTQVIKKIKDGLELTREFMKKASRVIFTFGTSYVFEFYETGIIASNCHKIDPKQFKRYRLSQAKVSEAIKNTVREVTALNNNCEFILTVSPVRHWKDGAAENQLSKSTLLLAVNETVQNHANSSYFPSYEIMMDDLREYRYYESDLVHPNKIATDYIWEKFSESMMSANCRKIIKDTEAITRARTHRVRNPESEKHKQFMKAALEKIKELQAKYPHIDFTEEEKYFAQ
jgi:hypothetical protein